MKPQLTKQSSYVILGSAALLAVIGMTTVAILTVIAHAAYSKV